MFLPALKPSAVFRLPEDEKSAHVPMAVTLSPTVLQDAADAPTATLQLEVFEA
jgi:hypothetical protein